MEERNVIDTRFPGRTTQQRHLILEIIEWADRHLDADEIYRRARQTSRNISLSTVYRNLQLFKEHGLVKEHQIVCVGCGIVFEFTCPLTEKIKFRLTREKGFEVTDVDVRFMGYCPECQRQLQQKVDDKELAQMERR